MWKNDRVGGGEESVKYTFPQQMRIRSGHGSGFKSKSEI
jgi:hypothetical protein